MLESQRFLHRRSQSSLMRIRNYLLETSLLYIIQKCLLYEYVPQCCQIFNGTVVAMSSGRLLKVLRSPVKSTYFMRASKSITLSLFSSPTNFELLCRFFFLILSILRNQDVIFHKSPSAAFPASWQNPHQLLQVHHLHFSAGSLKI